MDGDLLGFIYLQESGERKSAGMGNSWGIPGEFLGNMKPRIYEIKVV